MTTTYQVERLNDVRGEIEPLLEAHYHEICAHPDELVLDVNWGRYRTLEEIGMLRIFTVRDDGKLIGYCVTFMHAHPHYQGTVFGVNDVIYLDPAYRGTSVGYRLMKKAVEDLKSCGVRIVAVHMKIEHPFRELLTALGFRQTEENWEMVI